MLETIYAVTPGTIIRQDGGLLVIEAKEKGVRKLPIATIGELIIGRTVQISTQTIFSLVSQGTVIQFVDYRYNVIGTLGNSPTRLHRLLWQVKYFQDTNFALQGARYVIERKIQAQLALISQYSKTREISHYQSVRKDFHALLGRVQRVKTIEALRGVEGVASKMYFSLWGHMLSSPWTFMGRRRHPSPDPVNALLSYGYSFLEREVRSCLLDEGLDLRIGVLHSTNNRKDSFVYDVMDLLRQEIIDRYVLKLLNQQTIKKSEFDITERGCFLQKETQKKWINLYEKYMCTNIARLNNKTPRKWLYEEIKSFLSYLIESSKLVVSGEDEAS